MTETIQQEKSVGNYKVKFKAEFDRSQEDKIFLRISLSKDMQDLLKLAKSETVTTLTVFPFNDGVDQHNLKRYKIKDWIYSSLYSNFKECMFIKELVDSGESKLPFANIGRIDQFIEGFKENFRTLIEVILKSQRIDTTVNYNVK